MDLEWTSLGATSGVAGGRELLVFAGCNYLGLAQHEEVLAALRAGLAQLGISASASRATTGSTRAHRELEERLARFLDCKSALVVPSGYVSNLVLAQGLAAECASLSGSDRWAALCDRQAHVSILDGLAAAGIERALLDLDDSAGVASWLGARGDRRRAIFTDGVFPSRARIAPLAELHQILGDRGLLVIDDCHGLGVLGEHGRGSAEHCGVQGPRIVITGTFSKALGTMGGFVAGEPELIERCREHSAAYLGATPIPGALALATRASLDVLEREPKRRLRLAENIARARKSLGALRLLVHDLPIPVFAFGFGSRAVCERVHQGLLARGILVPHVRYPDGLGDYLRCAISSEHTQADMQRLAKELALLL